MNVQEEMELTGLAIIDDIYSDREVNEMINALDALESSSSTFRRSKDLFAIRQFLKEAPAIKPLIFTPKLKKVLIHTFGADYFVTKSIYFDKPPNSNWFVAFHQDLTISVDVMSDLPGFMNWTAKQGQFAVQPPLEILADNFTLRIHLDDTDEQNGALKVIATSHTKGIYRPETIDWTKEREVCCSVKRGGVMVMKPLLLHASNRTTNEKRRRVIHIEFSKTQLPDQVKWSETATVFGNEE